MFSNYLSMSQAFANVPSVSKPVEKKVEPVIIEEVKDEPITKKRPRKAKVEVVEEVKPSIDETLQAVEELADKIQEETKE